MDPDRAGFASMPPRLSNRRCPRQEDSWEGMDEARRQIAREIQLEHLNRAIEGVKLTLSACRAMIANPRATDYASQRIMYCEEELALLEEQRRLVSKTDPSSEEIEAMATNSVTLATLAGRERARRQRAVRELEDAYARLGT
jgi:hypothetical protein